MKRTLFHIGLPKTGTSSIQNFVLHHAGRLREQGILFPFDPERQGPAYFGKGLGQAPQADMMAHFFGLKGKTKPSGIDWQRVFDDFRADPALTTMIVSHEGQSVNGHRLRADAYRAALGCSGGSFLAFLREPAAWLNSLRVQAMTSWRGVGRDPARFDPLERYLEQGFAGMLAPFAALAPVTLRDYDRIAAEDRLIPSFLEVIGADLLEPEAAAMKRVNAKSFDTAQVLFLHALKADGCETADFVSVKAAIIAENRKNPPARGRNVLPLAAGQAVRARWEQDRDLLHKQYGITFADPGPLTGWPERVRLARGDADRLRPLLEAPGFAAPLARRIEAALRRAAASGD
ncbi:MAG: hypothetical protein KDK24_15020 [Pseudooceanicola sp.]|nr:hypothetical protein [Pseudooceanicola sp.]